MKRFKGKTQILDPETKTRKLVVDKPTKGLPRRDVWEMSIIAGSSKERLEYRTQKPLALLERIIAASSNPGDLVLDPFCGCGTTVHAAETLGRRWIGIDVTHLAIALIEKRLSDAFPEVAFETHGVPQDLAGAQDLFNRDAPTKKEFEKWACWLIRAYPHGGGKMGADGGVDGIFRFGNDRRAPGNRVDQGRQKPWGRHDPRP